MTNPVIYVASGQIGPVGPPGGVTSVNGETGVVVLDAADVAADPAGTAAAGLAVHTADTTNIHGITDTNLLLTTSTKLDDLAAPDDNTDLNASTLKHGLMRKLSGSSLEYMDGTGVFSVPAGGTGGGSGAIDGGSPGSVYGGTAPIDGGTP